ncbi:MAG: lysophospholipid acyltransferase family protein, partial [Bacteroidales bacterium]
MWFIINFFQIFSIALFTVFTVILIILWPLNWIYWYGRKIWGPFCIFLAGGKVVHHGRENIQKDKNYIFVANHSSYADIPVLFTALNRDIHFIAKQELSKVPFLGWIMAKMQMVFIDRTNKQKSYSGVKTIMKQLSTGFDIAAFPEGTRSKDGTMTRFKKG